MGSKHRFGEPVHTFLDVDLVYLDQIATAIVNRPSPMPFCMGLVGTLGAGKTRFVQAVASAGSFDSSAITSPTFSLLQTYHSSLRESVVQTLHHLDLYRVGDADELWELGIDELFEQTNTLTVIEWADRFADELPDSTIWIEITPNDADVASRRTLKLSAKDATQQTLILEWFRQVAEVRSSI